MIETRRIETAPGLVFDVSVAGDADMPLVLMLHGFCVSRHFWNNQLPALAEAGYFAVAARVAWLRQERDLATIRERRCRGVPETRADGEGQEGR